MFKNNDLPRKTLFNLNIFLYIIIIIGILGIILKISFLSSYKTTVGTISEISMRGKGMIYYKVDSGGEGPCKIKVRYTDLQGNIHTPETYEFEPCSKFPFDYFNVGDEAEILYNDRDPADIKLIDRELIDLFFVVIILIVFPLFLRLIPKRKLREFLNKI